jgi:serine protease Do
VVVISVSRKIDFDMADESSPFWDWLPPQMRKQLEERQKKEGPKVPRSHPRVFDGQGSGVIVREDGYILTNGHVVRNAEKIRVRLQNRKVYDAVVKGIDPMSDLAVVKIDAKGLPAAKFADVQKVRVGEFAIAIGAPFDLDYSITFGHVSAKGRSGIIIDPSMDQDFIQTDASINPGNSGGPLVNIDGEVIGINTLIRGMNTGIGFAIPCSLAREVGDALIADGKYVRAWLGLEIRALSEDPDIKDMVKGVEEGVVVRGIRKDGPAANSELKLGDVITSVDGRPVGTSQMLRNEVRSKKAGSTVVLDVVRKDKTVKVKVKTDTWPEDQTAETQTPVESSETTSEDFGFSVKPMTKELAKEYGVEVGEGMLVTSVEEGALAQRKGIQKGDLITEINQNSTKTLREYKAALKEADLKKGVLVTLISQGVSKLVVLKDTGD